MRIVFVFLSCLLLLLLAAGIGLFAWHATAVHLPAHWAMITGGGSVVVLGLAVLIWWKRRALAWSLVLVFGVIHIGWFAALTPRADRDWAVDLERITTGAVVDGVAELRDMRAFVWDDAGAPQEANWLDAQYDLGTLERVDLLTSTWGDPDIAHIMASFHFADGRDVVWTIEARREVGEVFNGPGGFFRQFELGLIAAPESDAVDVRVYGRAEDVTRFPTTLTPEQGAVLFEEYVKLGNALVEEPEFYHIILGNCTTVAWQLAHALKADLPLHPGLVLSGRLPDYLDTLGVLEGEMEMAARREAGRILP